MSTNYFFKYAFLLGLSLSLSACDADREATEVDYSNCRYEQPEAIFYEGLAQIRQYRFETSGKGSEETFILAGAIRIRIRQYGCDYRTQEFIFELPERKACDQPDDCTQRVAQLLQSLARLGPEYHVFRSWGQAVKETASQISFGKSTQIADGFWVQVDREEGAESTTLLLTLSEKP